MSVLHRKGYRVPSPELERELRTLLGKNKDSLWRADDATMIAIREADPAGFVGFMKRHRAEVGLSHDGWQNHLKDERRSNMKTPQKLPTLAEREAEAVITAKLADAEQLKKDADKLAADKRSEALARGEKL